MNLGKDQENAARIIFKWLQDPNDDRQYLTLSGFAGTGKTTLLSFIISEIQKKIQVICVTPTWKAANVLGAKLAVTNPGTTVTTIHSLIYKPIPKMSREYKKLKGRWEDADTNLRKSIEDKMKALERKGESDDLDFEVNDNVEFEPGKQIIICDESSMVDEKMRDDLLDTGSLILFVGDHGQLPPVNGKAWFHERRDATLNEIHRQAFDNPIIRLSMEVREGLPIFKNYQTDQCRLVHKEKFDADSMVNFDKVITGRNKNRQMFNSHIRKQLGYTGYLPQSNEKLICIKSGFNTEYKQRFINGIEGKCVTNHGCTENVMFMDVEYAGKQFGMLDVNPNPFFQTYLGDDHLVDVSSSSIHFDYAYAITAHKSQGSEWDKVIIRDDKMFSEDKEFRKKWLYTAVTRAKEQLWWVY